ncbi:RES family NAD+ phosphorylase [Thauera sedimentorum]|uniref:RES family NAD+ phosphorylase n=1 Tax=Thauera sedimentorum TaxID=2767595 RepID=UPI001CA782C0
MSSTTWTPPAVASEARPWAQAAWRIVEAQHVASTMKLVDDAAEQDLLEALLEEGKPPLPPEAAGLDYLLATPFRYDPPRPGSRFRAATDPGVFYAAQHVRTACAELAYWRWRFLIDAVDLERLEPVAHTAFRVRIATKAVDLRRPPFDRDAAAWTDPLDYRATQAFAAVARQAGIGAIVYRSVRDPRPAWCVALLTPTGFAAPRPEPRRQTWWIAVQRDAVVCRREDEVLEFAAGDWASGGLAE